MPTNFLGFSDAPVPIPRAIQPLQQPEQKGTADVILRAAELAQGDEALRQRAAKDLSDTLGTFISLAQKKKEMALDAKQGEALLELKKAEVLTKTKTDTTGIEEGLRKEFTRLSGEFITVRDAFARTQAAATQPTAAGDIALIFSYMKLLDPTSVVREGEFATAANAGGVPDRIQATYNRLLRGERLSSDIRKDFLSRSRQLYGAQLSAHQKLRMEFGTLTERLGGRSENVLIDFTSGKKSRRQAAEELSMQGLPPDEAERKLREMLASGEIE